MRTWFVGLLAIVIGILLAPSAFAQNAQITGSVKDSSGAIIPGATVTARNVDTGFVRVVPTNESGAYRLDFLPTGTYVVEVSLDGETLGRGEGPNRRVAETEAATTALEHLETADEQPEVERKAAGRGR